MRYTTPVVASTSPTTASKGSSEAEAGSCSCASSCGCWLGGAAGGAAGVVAACSAGAAAEAPSDSVRGRASFWGLLGRLAGSGRGRRGRCGLGARRWRRCGFRARPHGAAHGGALVQARDIGVGEDARGGLGLMPLPVLARYLTQAAAGFRRGGPGDEASRKAGLDHARYTGVIRHQRRALGMVGDARGIVGRALRQRRREAGAGRLQQRDIRTHGPAEADPGALQERWPECR